MAAAGRRCRRRLQRHDRRGAAYAGRPGTLHASTRTEGAHGLAAQSIGGGGGNGAVNVSAGISYGSGQADGHALLVGVGGFGGVGGNAGNVDVDVTGRSITAYGNGRSGILASSIGGGGGAGGLNVSGGIVSDSALIVGVGGMGGNGGTGGNVSVTAVNDLVAVSQAGNTTNGAGLMAQSIGGGGGDGGLNVSGGISFSKEKNVPSVTFGIGGFGGAGAIERQRRRLAHRLGRDVWCLDARHLRAEHRGWRRQRRAQCHRPVQLGRLEELGRQDRPDHRRGSRRPRRVGC